MKAVAAGEFKNRFDNLSTGRRDAGLNVRQIIAVEDNQRAARRDGTRGIETALYAAVGEFAITRAVIRESPSKSPAIKVFCPGHVRYIEFDLVDTAVVVFDLGFHDSFLLGIQQQCHALIDRFQIQGLIGPDGPCIGAPDIEA